MSEQIFTVEGMTCAGCLASVERAIKRVSPQANVNITLDSGRVVVSPAADSAALKEAIESAGFDVSGL